MRQHCLAHAMHLKVRLNMPILEFKSSVALPVGDFYSRYHLFNFQDSLFGLVFLVIYHLSQNISTTYQLFTFFPNITS